MTNIEDFIMEREGIPAGKFFRSLFLLIIPSVAYLYIYQNFKIDLADCYRNTSCEEATCCQDYKKTWSGGD